MSQKKTNPKMTNPKKKIRVLVAKPGLDGHERGAHVVAYGLRDAGFEVIYTGLRQTTKQIINTAIQEDVDVVGLSILSGAHLSLSQKVIEGLKSQGAEDIMVIVGGIVPEEDIPLLKDMGVCEVFTAGTPVSAISDFISASISSN
jgi:methylmalonyl-CoA mutase C-terminal domain/subunit